MELLDYLRKLFAYDDWANREVLTALNASSHPTPRSLGLMSHIIAAEWVWLARLKNDPVKMPVWPELSLDHCQAEIVDLHRHWKAYLDGLTRSHLQVNLEYTNSKGQKFSNQVADILVHTVMHSAYHRGQIASDMRAAGQEPAYTDFIHGVRSGRMSLDESGKNREYKP